MHMGHPTESTGDVTESSAPRHDLGNDPIESTEATINLTHAAKE